jgi:hypothetical protein
VGKVTQVVRFNQVDAFDLFCLLSQEYLKELNLSKDSSRILHCFVKVATTQKITVNLRAVCRRRWLWLWITLALLALPLSALAQRGDIPRPDPVILTDQQEQYLLGLHLELLVDPSGQLTIEDITSLEYDDQFTPSQDEVPNFGYTDAAVWVRFQVDNEANPANSWRLAVEEERHGYIDMYAPAPDGSGLVHQQAGRLRPFSVREVPYRYAVFKLPLLPDQDQTVYLRFQSPQPMLLPLTIWSLESFANQAASDLLKYGLFFGVMLVMLVYNLFLFASLRDRSYLLLVLFIASFSLHIAFREGLAKQYLVPDQFTLDTLIFTTPLSLITLILFTISFLKTKVHTPSLHKVLVGVALLTAFSMLSFVSLLIPGVRNYAILLGMFAVIVASFLTLWRGYRPARFYALAWLFFLGIIVINSLINFGLLPEFIWARERLLLGAIVMVLLMSLALADRINLLQAETANANRDLRDSEYRLNQFLEALPIGVTVYDIVSKLSFANQYARRLLHIPDISFTHDELSPTLDQEVNRLSPRISGSDQPYPPERMPVFRALQGEKVTVDDMVIPDLERPIQLEVSASPILDGQNKLQYAIVAFQDITTRKQMEHELRHHSEQLEEVVVERTQELTSFLDLTMLIGDDRTLIEVLDSALDRIIDLGKCHAVCLHLIEKDESQLKILTSRGLSETQHNKLRILPLEPGLSDWFSNDYKPELILDLSTAPSHYTYLRIDDYSYYLGIQLETRNQVFGLLSYYREEKQPFSLDDISLLTALAEQIRIVIENHRLRDEIEEIAVISERQRLARDMHESINQSLYSLSLFALAGQEATEDGDTERLANSLERIEAIALDARREMRLLLHQLQPPILTEKSLAEALHQRIASVERRLGIEVDYQVDGHIDLPQRVAEGLYWAAIEAMNNSLQHADTCQMTVHLKMAAQTLTLKITDDGRGFDREQVSTGLGMKNIQERVEKLDGNLTISSAPDAGTTVEIVVHVTDVSDKG